MCHASLTAPRAGLSQDGHSVWIRHSVRLCVPSRARDLPGLQHFRAIRRLMQVDVPVPPMPPKTHLLNWRMGSLLLHHNARFHLYQPLHHWRRIRPDGCHIPIHVLRHSQQSTPYEPRLTMGSDELGRRH